MRPVGRGLKTTVNVLEDISKGNLVHEFPGLVGNDEVGDMTVAMRTMSGELRKMIHGIAETVGVLLSTSTELTATPIMFQAVPRKYPRRHIPWRCSAEEMAANISASSECRAGRNR